MQSAQPIRQTEMYVRQLQVPKKTEPNFTPVPKIKGLSALAPNGKFNVIIYNWKVSHELEDLYPQLYIDNRAIRNSPNYLTTATYKLKTGNFLILTSKNIVNVIGIYNYSRLLSYCFQEQNIKTRVELILALLTEEIKTKNICCQTKIEKIGPGYGDSTKTKHRQKLVPYAKKSLVNFGMLEPRIPGHQATQKTTEIIQQQTILQRSKSKTTSRLEEANMEIVQVTDRNTEVIGKVSADGSNVDEVFSNTCFNSIRIYDGTMISIPYKPEDIFHITAPEIMKFVTKEEQKKLILHQAFVDYQYCLQRDQEGLLLIHLAIMNDDMDLFKRQCVVLHARGHSVDVISHNMTPLQMALSMEKREEFAKFLIDRGADLLAKRDGRTALHIIAEKEGDSAELASYAMEYLLRNVRSVLENNRKLRCEKMQEKTDDELKQHLLMQIGQMFDRQGYNPLMLATRRGNRKVMEVFLQLCPDIVDIQTPNYGKTALSLAIQDAIISQIMYQNFTKHTEVIKVLINFNANPLLTTNNGETVFDQLMGANQNHILEPLKKFISEEMSNLNPSKAIGIYKVVNGEISFSTLKKVNPKDMQNVFTINRTGKIQDVITMNVNDVNSTKIYEGNVENDVTGLEFDDVLGMGDKGNESNEIEATESNEKGEGLMETSNLEEDTNIRMGIHDNIKLTDAINSRENLSSQIKIKPLSELQSEQITSNETNKKMIKIKKEVLKIIPFHKMHAEKLAAEHERRSKIMHDENDIHKMHEIEQSSKEVTEEPSKITEETQDGAKTIENGDGEKHDLIPQEVKLNSDKIIKLKVQKIDKNGSISELTIEAPARSLISQDTSQGTTRLVKKNLKRVYFKPGFRPRTGQTTTLNKNQKDTVLKTTNLSHTTYTVATGTVKPVAAPNTSLLITKNPTAYTPAEASAYQIKIGQTFSLNENPKMDLGLKTINVSNMKNTVNIPATVNNAATPNAATVNTQPTVYSPIIVSSYGPKIGRTYSLNKKSKKVSSINNISATVNIPATGNTAGTVNSPAAHSTVATVNTAPTVNIPATVKTVAKPNASTTLTQPIVYSPVIVKSAVTPNNSATVNIPAIINPNIRKYYLKEIPVSQKTVIVRLPNEGQNNKMEPSNQIPNKVKNVVTKINENVVLSETGRTYKRNVLPKNVLDNKNKWIVKNNVVMMQNPDDISFIDISKEQDNSVNTQNTESAADNNVIKQSELSFGRMPLNVKCSGEINNDEVHKIDEIKIMDTIQQSSEMIHQNQHVDAIASRIKNSNEKRKLTNSDITDNNNSDTNIDSRATKKDALTRVNKTLHVKHKNIKENLENSQKKVQISSTSKLVENIKKHEVNFSIEEQKPETGTIKVVENENSVINTDVDSFETFFRNNIHPVSDVNDSISNECIGSLLEEKPRKRRGPKPKTPNEKRTKIEKSPSTSNSANHERLKENILMKKHDIKQAKIVLDKLTDEKVEKLLRSPSEELEKKKRKSSQDENKTGDLKTETTKSKIKILSIEVIKPGNENIIDKPKSNINDSESSAKSESDVYTSDNDVNKNN